MCERLLLLLLLLSPQQKSVAGVGVLQHSVNAAADLPQIRDHFSAKLGGLTSSFSTVNAPAMRLPSCPSGFALLPGISAGAFQPRVRLRCLL